MKNIKVGMVLKPKSFSVDDRKVIDVLPNSALLKRIKPSADMEDLEWFTAEEIEQNFILPEEKWEPQIGEKCFYISSDTFEVYSDKVFNLKIKRIEIGNCFPTRESAQKKAEELKAVLIK